MPEFNITAPDGRQFKVTAPEGATAQQALEQVQKQQGTLQRTAPDPTTGERLPFYGPQDNPAFPPQAKAAAQTLLPHLTDPQFMRGSPPSIAPNPQGKVPEAQPVVDPRVTGAALDIANIAQFAIPFGGPALKTGAAVLGANVLERSGTAQKGIKEIQKFLSPQSVSPVAGEAAASIRSAGGRAARDTETTRAAMEPWRATVNAMPPQDQLNFINYVEGQPAALNPQMRAFADILKDAMTQRRTKLEALPETAQMQFVEDYFPHFWTDPQSAQTFAANYGRAPGRQGSGASLRKRTVPTIADGIAAGLTPLTTDPIEATMRYVSSMDRFIASTEVLGQAKRLGTVRYIRPKTMGASGHPDSYQVPPGWVPIKGRGSVDATGAQAYAPEDWARVYNNYIGRGFHEMSEEIGRGVDAFQNASNAITGLELGLSGYHAFTMANEAVISEVARAVSNVAGGSPIKGLTVLGKAPGAFISGVMKGKKVEQVYLGRTQATPDFRKVVDLYTEAGGRAVGKSHASDYKFSAAGSYFTAWRRGALKHEAQQSLQNIKDRPIVGTAKEIFKNVGRVMETVAQPLFEKYIPRLKNAAFYDLMSDWLAANPQVGHAEQLAMARRIVDSMDDRFGELIQDNIFWHKAMKQTAQIVMRSYSWNFGTIRTLGGGALKAMTDPRRLSITNPDYDPRVAYVLAMAITVPTIGATYQYLKTGKRPESIQDVLAPRTGGTAPGFAGRGTVPEGASLPGYQKDVLGWYNDPVQEAKNKQSRLMEIMEEVISGKDWRGHSIADPNAEIEMRLAQYLKHVAESLIPISVQTIGRGQKRGSNISLPEEMMGIRPAPGWLQDPEGTEKGLRYIRGQQYKREQKSERKTQSQYGGPQE